MTDSYSLEDRLHELQDSYDEAMDLLDRLNNVIIDLTEELSQCRIELAEHNRKYL